MVPLVVEQFLVLDVHPEVILLRLFVKVRLSMGPSCSSSSSSSSIIANLKARVVSQANQITTQGAQIANLEAQLATAHTSVPCHTLDDDGKEGKEERIQPRGGGGGNKRERPEEKGDSSAEPSASGLAALYGNQQVLKRVKKEKPDVEEHRDDEVDERQIAHSFIEKQKDDMDELRKQVTALGERPVL